jgi:hypothetical protein
MTVLRSTDLKANVERTVYKKKPTSSCFGNTKIPDNNIVAGTIMRGSPKPYNTIVVNYCTSQNLGLYF